MNSINKLRSSTIRQLSEKYVIVGIFDFAENDSNLFSFYQWCKQWKAHSFSHNQRLLILNIDTDFYHNTANPIGNNNFNFFKCCTFFNIATEFIIYFSATYGMHFEINQICKLLNLKPPTVIESIFVPGLTPTTDIPNFEFNPVVASKKFISLNRIWRSHRILFLCYLKDRNLLDSFYVTYLFYDTTTPVELGITNITLDINVPAGFFRTLVPFTRLNDLLEYQECDHKVINKYSENFINIVHDLSKYTHLENIQIDHYWASALENGLIYVITETVFDYPYPVISEKTIKAILSKRPFIIVGSTKTIALLHKLGFKTFDAIWDESYDDINNSSARMSAIIDILIKLDNIDLSTYYNKLKEIVDYNYNHYINTYIKDDGLRWFNE